MDRIDRPTNHSICYGVTLWY